MPIKKTLRLSRIRLSISGVKPEKSKALSKRLCINSLLTNYA